MAKKKTAAAPSASETAEILSGETAHGLAVQYRPQVEPRLPAGMIDALASALATLGAAPPAAAGPAPAAAAAGPALVGAAATLEALVSAVHAAVRGAKPKAAVRKAYGAGSRAVGKDVADTVKAGEAIVARATAQPAEALGLGLQAADVAAVEKALSDVAAAEAAAKAKGAGAGQATGKERRAALASVREATARIAGAGALAFALEAPVRAAFQALVVRRKR